MKIAAWAAALVLTAATSVWAQTAAPPKSQADVLYAEAVAAHKNWISSTRWISTISISR
jgi:hypothetical protein